MEAWGVEGVVTIYYVYEILRSLNLIYEESLITIALFLILSMASVVQFWTFASYYFLVPYLFRQTVGRTAWARDQLVARPLPTQNNTT
jgi:hypothetical protein